jgi:hypothetical protein
MFKDNSNNNQYPPRFTQILCELALSKNNYHIGSGLGGDPKTFLYLLLKNHQFSDNQEQKIVVDGQTISWSKDFLANSSRLDIRAEIELLEDLKLFNHPAVPKDADLVDFSKVEELTNPLIQEIATGAKLIALLANELDNKGNNVENFEKAVADYFQDKHTFSFLICCRNWLGIERIVKLNLDQSKHLKPLFNIITKSMYKI